jgi:hypothetical protein
LNLLLPFLFLILGCNEQREPSTNQELTFEDLVDIENLEEVKMSNNTGTFYLTENQIDKLKSELSQMTYDSRASVKVGAINIELLIDGKGYTISTSTHGNYIEAQREIVAKNRNSINLTDYLYFKTMGVNFDNYTNQEK